MTYSSKLRQRVVSLSATLIVSARSSRRHVMPRHAMSARVVKEMWRYMELMGILISMHGLNSHKFSVTDHFLYRLSTF